MDDWFGSIKTRLLGLDKRSVSDYLQNLSSEYKSKLSELKKELDERYKEKSRLLRELESIKSMLSKTKTSKKIPEDVLRLAKKRTQDVSSFLDKMAEAEAQDIVSKAKKGLSGYDEKITDIKEEINRNKKKIDLLLGEVMNIVEGKEEEKAVKKDIKGITKDRESNDSNLRVISYANKKVTPIKDEEYDEDIDEDMNEDFGEDIEDEEELLHKRLDEYKRREKELEKELQLEKEKSKQNELFNINKAQKTADGLTLGNYPNIGTGTKKDIEGKSPDKSKRKYFQIEDEDETEDEIEDDFKAVTTKKIRIDDSDDIESSRLSTQDKPLENKIGQAKNTFIIGKLSGVDLTDDDGNVIISKGEVITEETVDKAEKSGKISELIINMVLAGLDD